MSGDNFKKTVTIMFGLLGVVFVFMMLEPQVRERCTTAEIVDLYRYSGNISESQIVVLRVGNNIEEVNVSLEVFYNHEIGDEVQACYWMTKYTKLQGHWRIEE